MKKIIHLIIGLLITFFLFASSLMTVMAATPVKFKVRIENISSADGRVYLSKNIRSHTRYDLSGAVTFFCL